jgi:chromosome segregation ATPase
MGYKVIDGIVYEVKEVDTFTLKDEIKKVFDELENINKEKARIDASIRNTESQFDTQIVSYQKQIDGLQALIDTIKEKREASIAPQQKQLSELDAKIEELTIILRDKKEVIEALLPEESKKLGL